MTGLILLFVGKDSREFDVSGNVPAIAYDDTFRLVLGILTGATGFFKLLSAVRGDVPVLGDLFPALAGFAGAFIILYDFYRDRSVPGGDRLPSFLRFIVQSKRYVGMGCLIAACLHFLFPTVLFL